MSLNSQAGELKAQGVVEAAQDPNSSVTAEDAQKKIVAESRKAGVAVRTIQPHLLSQRILTFLRLSHSTQVGNYELF